MSGWPFSKREVYPTDAELAEYLARLRDGYDQDIMGKNSIIDKLMEEKSFNFVFPFYLPLY